MTSTIIGIILAIPIALGAASNLAPKPIYLISRGIIAIARALHEIIVAILMVAIFGFGIWQKDRIAIFAGIAIFCVWIFMKLLFFFASKATKCPLCRANHFVSGKSVKHKKAYKIFPLSFSSTAVITAVLIRCVRCMHCGVTFDLDKKHR